MSNETLIHSFTKRRSRLVQFARRLLGEASDKTTPLRPSTIWPKVLPPPTAPVLHASWDFGSAEKENNFAFQFEYLPMHNVKFFVRYSP